MTVIVVGVDFSEPSKKALDAAVALAKGLGAGLVLVHANMPLPAGAKRGHLDPVTQLRSDVDADEVKLLTDTWAEQAGKSVKAEVVALEGKPADVVLDVAKTRKALYVVVGSHGRTGIRRAVLGSVAQAVVLASPIPVLVVPA
ncbi:MAG: universal stress protein [Candidatus Thermoplasmatota archaeon]